MVKVRVQGSWIYAPAHKTGSRQASRDYPSEPASQACHVASLELAASSSEGRVWTTYCRNRLAGLAKSPQEFLSISACLRTLRILYDYLSSRASTKVASIYPW